MIQLLEDDARRAFSVWFHWGRVGYKGQNNLIPCGSDLEEAKRIFIKKFEDKTKNLWTERGKFKKVHGKYDLVKIDYGTKDISPLQKKQAKCNNVASKLSANIQALIQLICDVKTMENMVVEMKYDAERAPLGKVNSKQIVIILVRYCLFVFGLKGMVGTRCDWDVPWRLLCKEYR